MRSFELVPGIDVVMQETGFDERLATADLVITGEGRIDAQTAYGKTALGVAGERPRPGCRAWPSAAESRLRDGGAGRGRALAVPVLDRPMTLEDAMSQAAPLSRPRRRAAGPVVELGTVVGERRSAGSQPANRSRERRPAGWRSPRRKPNAGAAPAKAAPKPARRAPTAAPARTRSPAVGAQLEKKRPGLVRSSSIASPKAPAGRSGSPASTRSASWS
jgi:hypothetical protein